MAGVKSNALVLKVISKLYFSSAHVLSYLFCVQLCACEGSVCSREDSIHTHVCVCICLLRPEVNIRCCPQVLSTLIFEMRSFTACLGFFQSS